MKRRIKISLHLGILGIESGIMNNQIQWIIFLDQGGCQRKNIVRFGQVQCISLNVITRRYRINTSCCRNDVPSILRSKAFDQSFSQPSVSSCDQNCLCCHDGCLRKCCVEERANEWISQKIIGVGVV